MKLHCLVSHFLLHLSVIFSCISYTSLNGRMTLNDELEKKWNEAVMVHIKELSQY